jgi:hypothetical protein
MRERTEVVASRRVWTWALGVGAAVLGIGAGFALPALAAAPMPTINVYTESAISPAIGAGVSQPTQTTGQEWFVGGPQLFGTSVGGTGQITMADSMGTGTFSAMVAGLDGFDWAVSNSPNALYAVGGAQNTPTLAATPPSGTFEDMAAGPDGNLYLADNTGSIDQCVPNLTATSTSTTPGTSSGPSATCTAIPFAGDPGNNNPDAIASVGGKLWFTDNGSDLFSMTTAGTFAGPFAGHNVTPYAHTLTAGPDGDLWAIGGGASADEIVRIDPATGQPLQAYGTPQGLPSSVGITSITTGPDGDLWFTDYGSNAIGQLNPSTGQISEHQLPSGDALLPVDAEAIVSGPSGSNTLWFGAETTGATPQAALGVISGIPSGPYAISTTTGAGAAVTVAVLVSGSGSVSSSPGGIACPYTCSATFGGGSTVTLREHPNKGQKFLGWLGACSGTAPLCTPSTDANSSVTARFTAIGSPRITGGSLTGVPRRRARLSLTVKQGTGGAKPLRSLSVALPGGLRFARGRRVLARAVTLRAGSRKPLRATLALRHGVLTITAPRAETRLSVVIAAPAIVVSRTVLSAIKRHKLRTLTLNITAKAAGGVATVLRFTRGV